MLGAQQETRGFVAGVGREEAPVRESGVLAVHNAQEITFAILGPLEIHRADQLIRLSGKHRAVLGVLLLDANVTVPRDRIVDALWTNPPQSAVSNVQTYVSGLRRMLAEVSPRYAARLETRGSGYLLHMDRDELDLVAFVESAGHGRRHIERGSLAIAERETQPGDGAAAWPSSTGCLAQ
jgi:DNA-binding winged helix-turn-helix (wHTH) protein